MSSPSGSVSRLPSTGSDAAEPQVGARAEKKQDAFAKLFKDRDLYYAKKITGDAEKKQDAYVKLAKDRDLYYAKKIAGLGQIPCIDAASNLNVSVWAPHLEHGDISHLLQPRSIETEMLNSMHEQMDHQKHMLKSLKHVKVLPEWMMEYAEAWEDVYKEKIRRTYDIGQPILTAMYETMFEIRQRVSHSSLDEKYVASRLRAWIAKSGIEEEHILKDEELVMRFLFRNTHSSDVLCHIAGAILQKSEVCGKPGAYAATRLRHDLTIKVDMCIKQLLYDTDMYSEAAWIDNLTALLATDVSDRNMHEYAHLFIDHTTYDKREK